MKIRLSLVTIVLVLAANPCCPEPQFPFTRDWDPSLPSKIFRDTERKLDKIKSDVAKGRPIKCTGRCLDCQDRCLEYAMSGGGLLYVETSPGRTVIIRVPAWRYGSMESEALMIKCQVECASLFGEK
jgi:hypothetical protein